MTTNTNTTNTSINHKYQWVATTTRHE